MAPKIIENLSKIRPGGDQWPLILLFLAFWSDAKNTWIFDASPVAQQIRKIGPSSGLKPIQGKRQMPGDPVFMGHGPRAAPFRARVPGTKVQRTRYRTRNRPEEGSNTPKGRWPGEFKNSFQYFYVLPIEIGVL